MMLTRLTRIFSVAFSLIFAIVIFTDYWQNNPKYSTALSYFRYVDLLGVLLIVGIGLTFGLLKFREKNKKINFVNGLTIFGGLLFIDIISITLFYGKINSTLTSVGLFTHLGQFILVVFCVFIIYLICRILGEMLTFIFPLKISQEDLPIIQTAIGIMAITFLLFVLGVFHLLKLFVIVPILLAFIFLFRKSARRIVKTTLIQPIKISNKLNFIGIFSFLFLSVFLVIDFAQILRPFPVGVDAINLYVNLPSLIYDHGTLISGNQPYNWSLFMSLGLLAFGRIDVVLSLSFLGGFLSLIALYRLSRRWLNINYSALVLLLFFSVPMINFLSYMDMKVDLGLLYFLLCTLIIFANWIFKSEELNSSNSATDHPKRKKSKEKIPNYPSFLISTKDFFANRIPSVFIENRLIVLMGLLAGFSLGIKLTALFFFLSLLTGIWYAKGGKFAFFGAFFFTIGMMFLLRLDEQPQLRQFHQNVSILQWLLIGLGIGLIFYLSLKQKELVLKLIRITTIFSFCFVLPMLPWFGKNILETKSFSVNDLLNGKKDTPSLDMDIMEEKRKEMFD